MGLARGRWAFPVLVVTCWLYAMAPRLVQTLTAPKHRMSVGVESPPMTALASTLQTGLVLMILGVGAVIVVAHLPSMPTDRVPDLALGVSLWAYAAWRDVAAGAELARADYLFVVVLVAVWMLRPQVRDLALLGWLTLAAAALNAAVGFAFPETGLFRQVDGDLIAPEKQILPGGLLVGVFTQGNNLGQLLAQGLPACLLLPRRWQIPAILAISTVVLWTASRSSLFAVGVAVAVAVLMRWGGPLWRMAVATAVLVGLAVVVVALPLTTDDPTAYSNRGYIWQVSLEVWQQMPAIGWGSNYYTTIGQFVNPLGSTAWHGHNQFVQTLVVGGLVQLALVGVLLARLVHRAVEAAGSGLAWPTAHLGALLISCALEVSFGVVDRQFLMTVGLIPLAAVLFGRWSQDPPPPLADSAPEPALSWTTAGGRP